MKFNSEEEIDDWFEDEKKAIHEKFLDNQPNNPEKSKKEFDAAMSKVLSDYEKYHNSLWDRQHKKEKREKPIKELNAKLTKKKKKLAKKLKTLKEDSKANFKHFLEESEKKKIKWHLRILRWLHRYR